MIAMGMHDWTGKTVERFEDLEFVHRFRKPLPGSSVQRPKRYLANWQSLQVLFVEDARNAAPKCATLVGCWGRTVRVEVDELSTRQTVRELRPDVVLLDLKTPLVFACETAKRLRCDLTKSKCLIIAIIGQLDESHRAEFHAAGIDILLIEPIDPSIFETLLMLESIRINRSQDASVPMYDKSHATSGVDCKIENPSIWPEISRLWANRRLG